MALAHPLRRVVGRDPHERGRVANTLELLYDLTFVVAFAAAGNQFAHLVAVGEWRVGLLGYALMLFATIWAWINATWFNSAFDTDDWLFRALTMVQMIGVVIFAIGIEPFFASLEDGRQVDLSIGVVGYVVMRLALGVQWLRVAIDSPSIRPTAQRYLIALAINQTGWIALAVVRPPLAIWLTVGSALIVTELVGPIWAERAPVNDALPASGRSRGTPWHPHHVAERYGLLFIITLGEGVVGTVVALSGAVAIGGGWTLQAALVGVAGIVITFALWWGYFGVSWGDALAAHPERAFEWGYGHIILLGGVAAIGAGLHVVALVIEGHAKIGPGAAVIAVVVPLILVTVILLALFNLMYRTIDLFHGGLLAGVLVILAGAVIAVQVGLGFGWSLIIAAMAPVLMVVAYETVGHQHQEVFLARARETARPRP